MKGNGAVQPLLFTMGNILSWVVEQITASSFIYLTCASCLVAGELGFVGGLETYVCKKESCFIYF